MLNFLGALGSDLDCGAACGLDLGMVVGRAVAATEGANAAISCPPPWTCTLDFTTGPVLAFSSSEFPDLSDSPVGVAHTSSAGWIWPVGIKVNTPAVYLC